MSQIDWPGLLPELLKLGGAFVLTLPIAWEREQATRLMGLRTFPIVALASCGYVLVAESLVQGDTAALARIIQGLMTGIGFIGGGAILKQDDGVQGTATAASVWSTGAIGAAVAFEHYDVAIGIVILNFLVLKLFTPLKESLGDGNSES